MNDKTLCFLIHGNPPTQILLGFKKFGFGAGKYAGFGGGVEAGETIETAAVRELEEESGIQVAVNDLSQVGQLRFLFPAKPDWSQVVHIFLAKVWAGQPVETDEMKPIWCTLEQIPFDRMWSDAAYWLPSILKGQKIKASFVFKDDNETVDEMSVEEWPDDVQGRQKPMSSFERRSSLPA